MYAKYDIIILVVVEMTLKELRLSYGISQKEVSSSIGIPLRTYIRYENINDMSNIKYQKMIDLLKDKYEITETRGILSFDEIKRIVNEVIDAYKGSISFCYIFGSYAKGYANEASDVDICISTTLTGLSFIGFVEQLHQSLKKNVDVIRLQELKDNLELLNEIMKDGIKIYG